ncbi:MAG: protein kinase [Desulfobacterales bacterium CG23_combo_of_CG06-09_8_20_14_all_51_8]|nr:MAG: protein kinase [Desulfobacterales bacterium CG23_combo_of_CG06-09_8_20_14_all_51_8]
MKERIFKDTTNFFAIDYGDFLHIDGWRYLIKGHEREERFGLDEPKFWVKKAADLETGERKIIKLSFFESFEATVGKVKIPCFRNPEKEGAILELVGDHPNFMHGFACYDEKGNNVRVLDIVQGKNFYRYLNSLEMEHYPYFKEVLPGILEKLLVLFESLRLLHHNGFRHGDIRNDHIIIEEKTGNYVWIDFDYDFDSVENPFSLDIMGLGNILLYALGKGFHNLRETDGTNENLLYQDLISRVTPEDFSIVHKWRFMNLKKLYPYIPRGLNNILAHFTLGSDVFYESVDEILADLKTCMYAGLK